MIVILGICCVMINSTSIDVTKPILFFIVYVMGIGAPILIKVKRIPTVQTIESAAKITVPSDDAISIP